MNNFPRKRGREAYFCDWSPGNESRCQCFFEKHNSSLDRGCRRCEQPCSKLEKARKLRLERNRVCGEFETMLNSCPGEGVVDTGCAKMMMYLNLLSSKERASIERVQEKNRFRFGDNETRISLWSAVLPMNVGGQVCREKVAIVAGDAPFLMSKPFLQRMGTVLDLEQGQVTFSKLGVTVNLKQSAAGHGVIDLISGCADSTTDESTRKNAGGSGSRNESGKDSEDTDDSSQFLDLICGSEKVTVIDASKPRVSLWIGLREILPPTDEWKFCEWQQQ